MTLEEYRIQIVDKVRNLRDPARARSLLEEVDLVLTSSRLTSTTAKRFWEELHSDLQVIADEASRLLQRAEGIALRTVVSAAQSVIAQHLEPSGRQKPHSI